MHKLKITWLGVTLMLLAACGGGGSSSGAGVEPTEAGQNIPDNFVGVYRGDVNFTATAAGLSESASFPITITVFADGTVRFDGDDPEETFTVGLTNSGDFAGNISIDEGDCSGQLAVVGMVDGSAASGTVEGEGECTVSGLDVDVALSGDFNAVK